MERRAWCARDETLLNSELSEIKVRRFPCVFRSSLLLLSVVSGASSFAGESGGVVVSAKGIPLMNFVGWMKSDRCAKYSLRSGGAGGLNTDDAVVEFHRSAFAADLRSHLRILSLDGTRQSVSSRIKSPADLTNAFRNLKSAKCIFSLESKDFLKLYRLDYDMPDSGLPNNPVKMTMLERCQEGRCLVSSRFDYAAAANFLDLQESSESLRFGASEYSKLKLEGRFTYEGESFAVEMLLDGKRQWPSALILKDLLRSASKVYVEESSGKLVEKSGQDLFEFYSGKVDVLRVKGSWGGLDVDASNVQVLALDLSLNGSSRLGILPLVCMNDACKAADIYGSKVWSLLRLMAVAKKQ